MEPDWGRGGVIPQPSFLLSDQTSPSSLLVEMFKYMPFSLTWKNYAINFSSPWWFLQDRPLEQWEGEDFAGHRQDSLDLQIWLHHAQLCAAAADSPGCCLSHLPGQVCFSWDVTGQVRMVSQTWGSGAVGEGYSKKTITKFSFILDAGRNQGGTGKLSSWIYQSLSLSSMSSNLASKWLNVRWKDLWDHRGNVLNQFVWQKSARLSWRSTWANIWD